MKPVQSFSFGGGVQSNAILVAIALGKLPKPDVCIIADTGFETRSTWEYLGAHGKPLMDKLGIPFMRVSRAETSLEQKYRKPIITLAKSDKKSIRIPAFITDADGSVRERVGKLRTFCSSDWKRDTIRWHLRQRFGRRRSFVEWIGYSTDEMHRAKRQQVAIHDGDKWRKRYPLIELGFNRQQAVKMVSDFGFPPPPRSSCWMCPNRSNPEWRDLRDNKPDEWRKAIAFEEWLKKQDDNDDAQTCWLTRYAVPLAQAPIDEEDKQGDFGFCDDGGCFT